MEAVSLYTTWPNPAAAEAAGAALIEARLAACVNIIPGMRSLYRWRGAIEQSDETVMLVKTTLARAAAARDALIAAHPYETPCVLHVHIKADASAPDFLAWLNTETA